MTWPSGAFKLHGGCYCQSVRYRVSVPAFEQRPKTVYCTPGADIGDDARIPAVYLDHCNDCRRATSAVLPIGLVVEAKTMEMSCLLPEELPSVGKAKSEDERREWYPVGTIAQNELGSSWEGRVLGRYASSNGRFRWFCQNCGTPLGYSVSDGVIPEEWGWPKMFDIWLGTVDREDLEKDFMRPERQLWCQRGVPWIRELSTSGARSADGAPIPQHPLTKIDKKEGDDITEDLKALKLAGKIDDPLV